MKYPRILAALRSAKWAVTPVTLQAIRDTLSARLTGHLPTKQTGDMDDDDLEPVAPPPPYQMAAPGVAVVDMCGIIGKNLSGLEMMCGGCDIKAVESNLIAALAAPETLAVVLNIDSPGGTVSGVAEFADEIAELSAAAGKPVLAYASGMCCSAAYWIACGCAAIACSPSSDVGAIGVYMALMDESANWAEEGYKLVLIKAGDFKAAGIAGSQITPEQIALWQADVDFIYAQFTSAVKAARPGMTDATMQGQSFYGSRALAAGLVDQLFDDVSDLAAEIAPTAASIVPANP